MDSKDEKNDKGITDLINIVVSIKKLIRKNKLVYLKRLDCNSSVDWKIKKLFVKT